MSSRFRYLLSALLLAGAGCTSTHQIETAPPQSVIAANPETTDGTARARLAIAVETGQTALPDEVEALRFRIDTVQLRQTDGTWTTYPADVNSFEIAGRRPTRKPILSANLPPAAYDSLALTFSDVFVLYDANSGGPLTMPREAPLRLPLHLLTTVDQPATLRLRFEPGASLSHDNKCRWYFLPFFELLPDAEGE